MSRLVEDIRHHVFHENECLFLDTNIWLRVLGPSSPEGHWTRTVYSSALRNMRQAHSRLFVDVLVLSEFMNGSARLWYHQSGFVGEYKRFRQSPEFEQVAGTISKAAKRIVRQCVCCESGFGSLDVMALLDEYGSGGYDFNDQVIARCCLERGFTLVTHDGDFDHPELPVLTANSQLLRG